MVILIVGTLLMGAASAGFAWLTRPQWQTHKSIPGGFKVDLPARPRDDMQRLAAAQMPNEQVDPNVKIEGTVLVGRLEEYAVVYVDLAPERRDWTAEQILDEAESSLKLGPPLATILSAKGATVSGFPGREFVLHARGEGTSVALVVVAETRLFIAIAGGRFVDGNDPRMRRFIETFEITDPKLLAAGAARKEAAQRAEADRRNAGERKQLTDIADSGAAVSRAIGEEAERARAEAAREYGPIFDSIRDAGRAAAQIVAETADREWTERDIHIRAAQKAGATAAFLGSAPPAGTPGDPAAIRGLVWHLGFDEPLAKGFYIGPNAIASSGVYPEAARQGPGVRGNAIYLPAGASINLVYTPSLSLPDVRSSITASLWFKSRAESASLFHIESEFNRVSAELGISSKHVYGHGFSQVRFSPIETERPSEGEWHHLAIVYKAAEEQEWIELYVDGIRTGLAKTPRDRRISTRRVSPLSIASRLVGRADIPSRDPVLAMDEVCLFNRALDFSEIRRLAGLPALAAAPLPRAAPGVAIAVVNRIQLNNAAAFDLKRNTLWVVEKPFDGTWYNAAQQLYLHRYSLPDGKRTGMYLLPCWVYRAVHDPIRNRLYLATAAKADAITALGDEGLPGGVGEVQSFDLGDLKENDGLDPPTLKPATTTDRKHRVVALALAPDGEHLLVLTGGAPRPIAFRFKTSDLYAKPLALEFPPAATYQGRIDIAADGKTATIFAGRDMARLDLKAWVLEDPGQTKFDSRDWLRLPSGTVFESCNNRPVSDHLMRRQRRDDGTWEPAEEVFKFVGFLNASPDGRFIICSGTRFLSGFWVLHAGYELSDSGDRLPVAAKLGGDGLVGPFTMSSDGRWALMNSGRLIRIWYSALDEIPAILPTEPPPVPQRKIAEPKPARPK